MMEELSDTWEESATSSKKISNTWETPCLRYVYVYFISRFVSEIPHPNPALCALNLFRRTLLQLTCVIYNEY